MENLQHCSQFKHFPTIYSLILQIFPQTKLPWIYTT